MDFFVVLISSSDWLLNNFREKVQRFQTICLLHIFCRWSWCKKKLSISCALSPVRFCLLTTIFIFSLMELGCSSLYDATVVFPLLWWIRVHSVKSVQIRSYFRFVFSCIQSKYRKIRTRNNYIFGHFSCSGRLLNVTGAK